MLVFFIIIEGISIAMLKIPQINNTAIYTPVISKPCCDAQKDKSSDICTRENLHDVSSSNLKSYHPSFCGKTNNTGIKLPNIVSNTIKLRKIKKKLDENSLAILKNLQKNGILDDRNSNDGTSVLDNLFKIATEPRIQGLNDSIILAEVLKALDNPYSITQKFGDIPDNVAQEISTATGEEFPQNAYNVTSSSCVVASMEFNLASKKPAEFVRFAQGLSSQEYSVNKKIKISDIANGTAEALWKLREFNTENSIDNNWDDVTIKLKPDRNAIIRARVQTSYKDPNERSCVDVLIQSALLNLGSQHTYNALTDERTGKFNPDSSGLTDFEKNFVEEIVFENPKISVVYQALDENGYLTGYNCEPEETKQHILKSLQLGQNVIVGYTHLNESKQVDGGHEITILDYKQDENGKGYFICNDTDDNKDEPISIAEEKLLPLIHHAGISQEALSEQDIIIEPWREILEELKPVLTNNAA